MFWSHVSRLSERKEPQEKATISEQKATDEGELTETKATMAEDIKYKKDPNERTEGAPNVKIRNEHWGHKWEGIAFLYCTYLAPGVFGILWSKKHV